MDSGAPLFTLDTRRSGTAPRNQDDDGRRIGGMMWGRPISPRVDQLHILELTRMYMVDDTEPYAESKALAAARRHIRKHCPNIRGLIAYSSTGEGPQWDHLSGGRVV